MKIIVAIIIFLFLPVLGECQAFSTEEQLEIDKLNSNIDNTNSHDTTNALAYIGLSEYLYISNFDTLLYLCEKAQNLAENGIKNTLNPTLQSTYLRVLGGTYNNLGFYYESKGDIENALNYYHKSLKIEEKTDNKFGLATILNNIGQLYYRQGSKDKVLEYYFRSLKLRQEIGDLEGVAISLGNIGYYYDLEGDLEKGMNYYLKSLKISEDIDDKIGIAYSLNNIAYVYKVRGETQSALDCHLKSLKIEKEINDTRGMSINLFNIALIYNDNKQYEKAKDYALKSLNFAKNNAMPDNIVTASGLLSDIYEKEKNWKKAFEFHKLYVLMKDSVKNDETQRLIAEQQAKYLYEKQKVVDDAQYEKEKIIDDLQHAKILSKEKEEKARQKLIIIAIGIGLGLVILFLIFIYNRLQITNKQKKIIEAQKEMVVESHKELKIKNQEITDSIKYAKRIQSAILPDNKTFKHKLKDSFVLYLPKDIVAGDFYWLEEREGKILFAVADCTGHGVPGAMVSVVCNNALNRSVREHFLTSPAQILNKSREIVIEEFAKSDEDVKDGMDIALCAMDKMKLEYAGANNPIWIIRQHNLIEIKANKQPIGNFEQSKPFTPHQFDLRKGDVIYLFSDGYVDQFGGEKGKKFKSKALKELLLRICLKPMPEQQAILKQTFNHWKGDIEQIDDVCIMGVRI